MMKPNKAIAAVAVGAAAIVTLGACSSGSDQAEGERQADQASTSASASPEAPPTNPVPLPKSVSSDFKDVVVTHSGSSKCSTKETANALQVSCTDVDNNFMGDQVFIRVPNQQYLIHFVQKSLGENEVMWTSQRNSLYFLINESQKPDVTWRSPYGFSNPETAWGVGVDGPRYTIDFVATVSKI